VKTQSEYAGYTGDSKLKEQAGREARRFVREETQFQLGHLPTEQSHPYTRGFSTAVQEKPEEGIGLLLKVDGDLPPVARRVLLSEPFDQLVAALRRVIQSSRKVCFSGCGSTGRLAMMLEEMWRQYWEDGAGVSPGGAARNPDSDDLNLVRANLACSIMTGGDRALIRSVENFEDFASFGRRQVSDLNLTGGDVLVAITEGGETSSVLGTVEEALERGCQVFLIYNNPTGILQKTVERSRHMIEHPDVAVLDLFSGSMALSGSTRMQATTLEMMIVGSAIEEALLTEAGTGFTPNSRLEQADRFGSLIQELGQADNRTVLADLAVMESDIYQAGGRVTYLASRFLLDIFSDTTERSPTFMLPPFRMGDDKEAAVSWAYAKDPGRTSDHAWFDMLRRPPRGLDWTSEDYRSMGAPRALIDNPPPLSNKEISRYIIGREEDPSRTEKEPCCFLRIDVGEISEPSSETGEVLFIGSRKNRGAEELSGKVTRLNLEFPDSPILLWQHLAVKLIFNTVSTASMGIMGRIRGNWMVQVDPTNKKLIDRSSRIISHLAGIPYEEACEEIFLSLLAREELWKQGGQTTTSPVVDVLDRLESLAMSDSE